MDKKVGSEYQNEAEQASFYGVLKTDALWRVPAEARTVAVLIETVGASLGWLLLPLFLTPVTTSQVSLIIPTEYYVPLTRKHAAAMCPGEDRSSPVFIQAL